ncbi:MAG: DUF447 family protein [Rhodocyclaceae bacterium]|nr:DUF447 family protein [Rhodocyclaceae bacterium]
MPRILETLVTTVSPAGTVHLAPMGMQEADGLVVLMPFRPSATLDNILASRRAVLNLTDDVRIFAGCVTGRRDWPTEPVGEGSDVRLSGCLTHVPLELAEWRDDALRPVLHLRPGAPVIHGPFAGFNRAQAAVIEGAVLVSRLSMLADDKVDQEMAYLQIAIDKTAGDAEREAWGWLRQAVADHRSGRSRGQSA